MKAGSQTLMGNLILQGSPDPQFFDDPLLQSVREHGLPCDRFNRANEILIPVTPEIAGGTEGWDLVLYKVLAQVTLLTKTEW